jgi:hypothetical protein
MFADGSGMLMGNNSHDFPRRSRMESLQAVNSTFRNPLF